MSKNDITGDEIKSRVLSKQGRENWDRIFAKKPSTEWAKEDGLIIYDPDGFDRRGDDDGVTPDTPITYKEYSRRIVRCTVMGMIPQNKK